MWDDHESNGVDVYKEAGIYMGKKASISLQLAVLAPNHGNYYVIFVFFKLSCFSTHTRI